MKINVNMKAIKLAVVSVSCGILSACGGNAGDPFAPPPVVSMQSAGWWSGVTNSSVPISSLITDSGAYYHFYASQGSTLINGVIIGNGDEDTTDVFSSTNGLDINFAGNGVITAQLTSNFVPKTSLNTLLTYADQSQFTFNSAYNPSYDQTPSLFKVRGNYLGDMVVVDNFAVTTNLGVTLAIDSNGVMAISNNNVSASCGVNGSIVPHGEGNVYDVNMTFSGSGCPVGVGAMNGNAFLDPITRQFYSVAMNSTRAGGLIFVGTQQ